METNQTSSVPPQVQIVRKPDGSILIVGGKAAAEYCGVSQQALGRVVRAAERRRQRQRTIGKIELLVRKAYPHLFEDAV